MNELMQKILLKAQQQAAAETIQSSFAYESKVYEKFAELIVQECVSVVYRCSSVDCHSDDEFIHAGDKIKEHFGVNDEKI